MLVASEQTFKGCLPRAVMGTAEKKFKAYFYKKTFKNLAFWSCTKLFCSCDSTVWQEVLALRPKGLILRSRFCLKVLAIC